MRIKKADTCILPTGTSFFAYEKVKSLFDLEFVLMDFVFIQILAPAAKNKTIFCFLVPEILSAE